MFLQFISGDRMYCDKKGVQGVEAKPTARLIVATNNRPDIGDRSHDRLDPCRSRRRNSRDRGETTALFEEPMPVIHSRSRIVSEGASLAGF
jgi:hypothetical protein